MWVPWRWIYRHLRPVNGHSSDEACASAHRKLERARARQPEVSAASDRFTAAVERAMRGVR